MVKITSGTSLRPALRTTGFAHGLGSYTNQLALVNSEKTAATAPREPEMRVRLRRTFALQARGM
eukprot:866884-Prymnesium_polylepis.1